MNSCSVIVLLGVMRDLPKEHSWKEWEGACCCKYDNDENDGDGKVDIKGVVVIGVVVIDGGPALTCCVLYMCCCSV